MSTQYADLQPIAEVNFYFDSSSIESSFQPYEKQSTVYGMCEECLTGWPLSEPAEPKTRLIDGKCDQCRKFCAFCEVTCSKIRMVAIGDYSYGVCFHCHHTLYNEDYSHHIKVSLTNSNLFFACYCECGKELPTFNYGECRACHQHSNRVSAKLGQDAIEVCCSCATHYMQRLAV